MSTDVDSRLRNILREHPALLVSAFYVAASIIGMFYAWSYLRHFDVNVFNYAQLGDFLLASLKEPFTWFLVIAAVLLVQSDNMWSRRVERKGPSRWFGWYGSPKYRTINNFVAIYIVLSFIYLYANYQAKQTRAGEGKFVDISFEQGGASETKILLGTTAQFVILYDNMTERVQIHPLESVHSIEFQTD